MKSTVKNSLKITSLALTASSLFAACNYSDFVTYDFLKVEAQVVASDGETPIDDLSIQNYRWIVSYKDGSTVSMPFNPALKTDQDGKFQFSSGELDLQSGNGNASCTDVCVATATSYDTVCTTEDTYTYDSCLSWGSDYYGDPVCLYWETQVVSECIVWEQRPYSYCTTWAQDCAYSYPDRNIDDIAYSQSEIDYRLGSSLVTTASELNPSGGYSTLRRSEDQRSLQWLEEALFITPLESASASKSQVKKSNLTAQQREIVRARNANAEHQTREVEPKLSRTHTPATRVSYDQLQDLTASQKQKLEEARQSFTQSQQ